MIEGTTYRSTPSGLSSPLRVNVRGSEPRRVPVILSDFPTGALRGTNHGIFWVRPDSRSRYFPTRSRKRPSTSSYPRDIAPVNGPARTTLPITGVAAHAGGDWLALAESCVPAASCPVPEPQPATATVRLTSAPAHAGNGHRFTRRDYTQR